MHLCICCHKSTRLLDGLHLLSCAFQRGPFRGLWRVKSDPLLYLLLCPSQLAYAHRYFYFCKVCDPTPYTFKKILRAPLCSWGFPFGCFVSDVFGGDSKVVKRTWWKFSRELTWIFHLIFLMVYFFVARLLYTSKHSCMDEFLWDRSRLLVPFWKGLQSFWRGWFVIVSNVLGSLFPHFCSCCPLTKKATR